MSDAIKILVLLAVVILLIICGPLATIWSLNTLFPVLAIPYTLDTWLAAFLLFAGVTGTSFSKRK